MSDCVAAEISAAVTTYTPCVLSCRFNSLSAEVSQAFLDILDGSCFDRVDEDWRSAPEAHLDMGRLWTGETDFSGA